MREELDNDSQLPIWFVGSIYSKHFEKCGVTQKSYFFSYA